ncbi:divergent polysaccharide deacetylase family protein [Brenneria populi]|uniref:Divergent polysaccharide deacetylase family protein n=1 Tax=Brenneria populi TaxID=1505588 RepID=A0ABU6JW58_9GAMM|nr:divergent polysaccharide deacetylase family protein [Brenneria populi Li et al. 2015]
MYHLKSKILFFFSLLSLSAIAMAGKLSIVIDDFGYRPHNENQVLAMPTAVSVAVLPNAPYAREMATRAHNQGREVLIHLPMAPLSKQPLERDTLHPDMSGEEIQRIIRQSVNNVPYAVGLNNHMGSAMTSSLPGMQKVMQALSAYRLYFLDSMTIGSSQASRAAAGTGVKVIKRKVFLDDSQNEADIRRQFNRAVQIARRSGSAIAIGHPHPSTIKVLRQMLPELPSDIVLVRPSQLLNEPTPHDEFLPAPVTPKETKPQTPPGDARPFPGIKQCRMKHPPEPVKIEAIFKLFGDSAAAEFVERRWQTWFAPAEKPH